MKNVIIFFAIAICGINAVAIDDVGFGRIVGGQDTTFAQFPYSVSLQQIALVGTPSRGHKCGGSLFTLKHVLTSATCTYDRVNGIYIPIATTAYRIFSGANLLSNDNDPNRIRSIANITVYPGYVVPLSTNNIAVITLSEPFLSTTVTPITLPSETLAPTEGTTCQIASWGARLTNESWSNALHSANHSIFNQVNCNALLAWASFAVTPSMICSASTNAAGCAGDEGISLACGGSIVGVLFFTNVCTPNFPDVFTRVTNYLPWIRTFSGSSSFRPELTFIGVLAVAIAKFISKE